MTKLMGWGTLVIYLGPALGLTPHRNATAVLAVALDGRLEVADDPASSNGTYRSTRSVLIPPNTLHHFRASGNTMAFLYVDPFSRDLAALMQKMRHVTPRAAFDLVDESAIAGVLTGLAEGRTPLREGRDALEKWLGIGMQAKPDARISSALQQMREQPGELHSLDRIGRRCRVVGVAVPAFVQGANRNPSAAVPVVESHGRGGKGMAWRNVADGRGAQRGFCQFGAFQRRLPRDVRHDAVGFAGSPGAGQQHRPLICLVGQITQKSVKPPSITIF